MNAKYNVVHEVEIIPTDEDGVEDVDAAYYDLDGVLDDADEDQVVNFLKAINHDLLYQYIVFELDDDGDPDVHERADEWLERNNSITLC